MSNEVTDSTNVAENNNDINDFDHDEPVETLPVVQKEKPNYEVVFFARYRHNPRPSAEEITSLFNNYGQVHHVNCPEGKNYAFIFMTSLSTTVEHRRTRTTIGQIIHDMTPETRFHITVASSFRGAQRRPQNPHPYHRGYNRYLRRPVQQENETRIENTQSRVRHHKTYVKSNNVNHRARQNTTQNFHRRSTNYRSFRAPVQRENAY